jgi:hypothetical protein
MTVKLQPTMDIITENLNSVKLWKFYQFLKAEDPIVGNVFQMYVSVLQSRLTRLIRNMCLFLNELSGCWNYL